MMRTFILVWAIALLGAGTPAPSPLPVQSLSLSGSVYRGTTGTTSTALVGALVYVHPTDADAGPWTGPAVTDAFGRFTFGDLHTAKYVLRIFVGRKRVWEQVVGVPGTLSPIVLSASSAS